MGVCRDWRMPCIGEQRNEEDCPARKLFSRNTLQQEWQLCDNNITSMRGVHRMLRAMQSAVSASHAITRPNELANGVPGCAQQLRGVKQQANEV